MLFALLVGVTVVLVLRMPTSFLPTEDQGYLIANVQLPPGATRTRTLAVMQQAEGFFLSQPEVDKMVSVLGFSFSGSGQNAALAFVPLKPWDEREGAEPVGAGARRARLRRARRACATRSSSPSCRRRFPSSAPPPASPSGSQDRGGNGHDALVAARNQLLGMAAQSKVLAGVRPDGLEDAPQLQVDIDRDRASALGVSFDAINAVLSTALGSTYVNDFPNAGRLQRVVVQADAPRPDAARRPAAAQRASTTRASRCRWRRWRRRAGSPGRSRRSASTAIRRCASPATPRPATRPATRWTRWSAWPASCRPASATSGPASRARSASPARRAILLIGFSLLAVFLCLSALYESWSIPFAVLLVVPLGVLGAVLGATLRGMPNDVFFKVGLITVIGLSAKNAILIIEFAKDLHAQGKDLIEATLEAVHLRFRPILMTSIAFILGVLPLVVSTGAGSASQRAIGTGVMGGMITATFLAIFFVPVFFVVVRRVFKGGGVRGAEAGGAPRSTPAAPAAIGGRGRPCLSRRLLAPALAVAARRRRLQHDPDLRAAGGAGAGDLSARDRRPPSRRPARRPPRSNGSASSPTRGCGG